MKTLSDLISFKTEKGLKNDLLGMKITDVKIDNFEKGNANIHLILGHKFKFDVKVRNQEVIVENV